MGGNEKGGQDGEERCEFLRTLYFFQRALKSDAQVIIDYELIRRLTVIA